MKLSFKEINMITGALKSKTVWLGVVVAALSALQAGLGDAGITPEQLGIVGPILGALIVWLRAITDKPLSQK
jgi:hypothetical protein